MSKPIKNIMTEDEMIKLLDELVSIKSVSNLIDENNKVQKIIERELLKTGMQVSYVKSKDKANLLVAEKPGSEKKYITLIAHGDVVNASDDFNCFHLNKNKNLAFGPGVIDCKGGVVIAISALKSFLKLGEKNKYPIRFICSPSEEIGSPGYINDLKKYGNESEFLLSFEPGLPSGDFVHSRAGNRWYAIEIKGRNAHSGRHFTKGVNAVEAMCRKVSALSDLTDLSRRITLAVTSIETDNHNNNTVPGYCKATIDTRFDDNHEADILHGKIIEILRSIEVTAYEDFQPALLTYQIIDYSPAANSTDKSKPYIDYYKSLLKKYCHREINAILGRGSADCNSMLDNKETVFIGSMGAYGGGPHTVDEYVKINSLKIRTQAAIDLLVYLNKDLIRVCKV